MNALIKVNNVSKIFTQGKVHLTALDSVDLTVNKGDFVVLRGVSGSGKSTLLNLIGGLLPPSSGEVNIIGHNFYQQPDVVQSQCRKQHIGFVFQKFYLVPNLTLFENVALPLKLLAKKDITKTVNRILEILGLAHLHKHRPAELSGGQQQRGALARAMVKRPQYIVADEPTASLDSTNSSMILNMLKQANAEFGNTIILTSHDPDIVEKLQPTKIITMQDGILCSVS